MGWITRKRELSHISSYSTNGELSALGPWPEYLPWLDDLLSDPYEIWMQLERETSTGAYRVRARILKAYDLGNGKALLLVADQQEGVLVGWTFVPVRSLAYVGRQRSGLL